MQTEEEYRLYNETLMTALHLSDEEIEAATQKYVAMMHGDGKDENA